MAVLADDFQDFGDAVHGPLKKGTRGKVIASLPRPEPNMDTRYLVQTEDGNQMFWYDESALDTAPECEVGQIVDDRRTPRTSKTDAASDSTDTLRDEGVSLVESDQFTAILPMPMQHSDRDDAATGLPGTPLCTLQEEHKPEHVYFLS